MPECTKPDRHQHATGEPESQGARLLRNPTRGMPSNAHLRVHYRACERSEARRNWAVLLAGRKRVLGHVVSQSIAVSVISSATLHAFDTAWTLDLW